MLLEFAYTYGNTVWKDLLTAYDGTAITYDTIGNPLSYRDGMTFAWQNGRELASFTQNGQTATYTYNDNGIRTSKTVNGHTNNMVLSGSTLVRENPTVNITLTYLYDESGHRYGLLHKSGNTSTYYYYLYNAQGDVIGMVDSNGDLVAQYTYNAWGQRVNVKDGDGNTVASTNTTHIANLNPFRYRGYYYDVESGFYYLQSRYYDPQTGRFINADGYASTGQGVLGTNMFAYCGNNPVNRVDYTGNRYCEATTVSGESAYNRFVSCKWQRKVALEKYNATPIGKTNEGNVYFVSDETAVKTLFPGDILIIDDRNNPYDPNVRVKNSAKITDTNTQREVLEMLDQYERNHPTRWSRNLDIDNMMIEWDAHNMIYAFTNFCPFANSYYSRALHVDLNNNDKGWSTWDKLFGEIF